jgi:hypothetical protein
MMPEPKKPILLRNGNPQGNPMNAPRYGAKTRRGTPCRSPAMANGRCRMHGGKSTGPRTEAGLARSRKARYKHGHYSAEAKALRKEVKKLIAQSEALIKLLGYNPFRLE